MNTHKTVAFSKNATNVFFHILTACNLHCRHCYINPDQHGSETLSLDTVSAWLKLFVHQTKNANLILQGVCLFLFLLWLLFLPLYTCFIKFIH